MVRMMQPLDDERLTVDGGGRQSSVLTQGWIDGDGENVYCGEMGGIYGRLVR